MVHEKQNGQGTGLLCVRACVANRAQPRVTETPSKRGPAKHSHTESGAIRALFCFFSNWLLLSTHTRSGSAVQARCFTALLKQNLGYNNSAKVFFFSSVSYRLAIVGLRKQSVTEGTGHDTELLHLRLVSYFRIWLHFRSRSPVCMTPKSLFIAGYRTC